MCKDTESLNDCMEQNTPKFQPTLEYIVSEKELWLG